MQLMEQSAISQSVKDIIYILGGVAVALGIIGVAVRFCSWGQKRWRERVARRNATKNALEAIEKRLTDMDTQRSNARREDDFCHRSIDGKLDSIIERQEIIISDLRLCVSATGAALDGLMQHDAKINGPVARWKIRLEDRVKEGVGEPKSPRKE
jgi:hypothetical protein